MFPAFRPVLLAILFAFALAIPRLHAQEVTAKDGKIVLTVGGTPQVLTEGGRDSDPALSPDGRTVAFVRGTPGRMISTGSGDAEATELWMVGADGKNAARLLSGATHPKTERLLAGMSSPQWSPDGRRIFFLSAAWATSGAVHVLDVATRRERFVCAGNSLQMLRTGEYRGHMIVSQHRYFLGGGSYDWHWLLRPDGSEVGPIGEDTEMFHGRLREVAPARRSATTRPYAAGPYQAPNFSRTRRSVSSSIFTMSGQVRV